MRRFLVSLVFVLALTLPALATTAAQRDLTCPVCGTAVKGVSIMSTNTFGGVDRDLLRRAAGSQPLLLLPTTCPKCHYSQWSGDFDKKVPDDVKKAVLCGALHLPAYQGDGKADGEGQPIGSSVFPAWVRHDLIAQVLVLSGASEDKIAWQYLNTAWAVRLVDNPFESEMKDEAAMQLLIKASGVPQDDNRAQYQVAVGRALAGSLSSRPAAERRPAAMLAGYLLRSHGEFPGLLAALPAIVETLPADQQAAFRTRVTASIEREQGYQKLALMHLTTRLTGGDFKDVEEKAVMLYLAGELYRRLGHPAEALKMYDDALAGKHPEGLDKWAKEQRALVAPK